MKWLTYTHSKIYQQSTTFSLAIFVTISGAQFTAFTSKCTWSCGVLISLSLSLSLSLSQGHMKHKNGGRQHGDNPFRSELGYINHFGTRFHRNRPDLAWINSNPKMKKKKKKTCHRHPISSIAHRTPSWVRVRQPWSHTMLSRITFTDLVTSAELCTIVGALAPQMFLKYLYYC